jgi:hypothetical protein
MLLQLGSELARKFFGAISMPGVIRRCGFSLLSPNLLELV